MLLNGAKYHCFKTFVFQSEIGKLESKSIEILEICDLIASNIFPFFGRNQKCK